MLSALLAERRFDLGFILLTHAHVDPGNNLPDLYPGAQVIIGGRAPPFRAACRGPRRAQLQVGEEEIRVIATPGHTACSVSYLWQDRVFCGDALELGGCSQAKDSDCDPGRLYGRC